MAVSSKKDKLIEEAQKLVLRGQFDKAVKIYEQVMALDPSAINLKQKFAELLIKAGRLDDARKEFETIGRHFSKNGFYLKAIAVYKQLQKLFPADYLISLTLAELNEKHGLTANALSEYKLVFDYYEKSGNSAEALKILDKMQAVDPGNVPIKIKLAEACYQNNKKDESYALFSKTASILQERGENVTLSKLNTRIQQLFPEKTGFVLEVFSEQIANGNAASIMNGLQGHLRSHPNDKRAWDLIVEAYRQLDQPQKIRAAYQHYFKFFPTDPVPMAGIISCHAAEGNLPAAMEQLDRYESSLISAGFLDELDKIYQALNDIDPINIKITEGMIRIARAAGKDANVEALTSKLQSLLNLTGKNRKAASTPEPVPSFFEPPDNIVSEVSASPIPSIPEQGQTSETDSPVIDVFSDAFAGPEISGLEESADGDIEIEIELDIDDDTNLTQTAQETAGDVTTDNWLDSVGGLFDSITTSPRGVRFGNEMDNSDAQSHFDLGLAFKEMGLYDEAINEFRQASLDASRRFECLILQGACLRDRGEYDTAENVLNALLKPGLSLEDSSAVKYELVLTYECAGKTDQATHLLNDIDSSNPGFRDVSSRLNAANLESSLDFSDDDLDGFGLK